MFYKYSDSKRELGVLASSKPSETGSKELVEVQVLTLVRLASTIVSSDHLDVHYHLHHVLDKHFYYLI